MAKGRGLGQGQKGSGTYTGGKKMGKSDVSKGVKKGKVVGGKSGRSK